MRGVYVPRVNHLGVISRPLAPTDITAIDCDLLPNVLQVQSFGHRRLLALLGHNINHRVSLCTNKKLITTTEDHIIH